MRSVALLALSVLLAPGAAADLELAVRVPEQGTPGFCVPGPGYDLACGEPLTVREQRVVLGGVQWEDDGSVWLEAAPQALPAFCIVDGVEPLLLCAEPGTVHGQRVRVL